MSSTPPSLPRDHDRRRPGRLLARRRGLPNGRAVLGGLLVTVAAVGTFAVASSRDDADRARYVVVARAVAPGARLTAADLALRPLALDADVASQSFTDPAAITGAVALGPLGAGQLLPRAGVALPSAGAADLPPSHELTIPVPIDRLPAGVRRGETVAVLATYGSGSEARTVVTVQQARVLAIGDAGDGVATRGTARLTVALADPTDVVETAHAAQVAELTIVRATLADGPLPATFAEPSTRAGPGTTSSGATGSGTVRAAS